MPTPKAIEPQITKFRLVAQMTQVLGSLSIIISTIWGCSESDSERARSVGEVAGEMTGEMTDPSAPAETLECRSRAMSALTSCVERYGARLAQCYTETGQSCDDRDDGLQSILRELEANVSESCDDRDVGSLSVADLKGRLNNACASEASSLAWRYFGGPQGEVVQRVDDEAKACLVSAHQAASELVVESLNSMNTCLGGGGPSDGDVSDSAQAPCDASAVVEARDALSARALEAIDPSCGQLDALIAISSAEGLKRAAYQADCLTATIYADPSPLTLSCGPSHAQFETPRGEWSRVVVDGDEWGTLCGDGSSYAFYIKWAPEGQPLDRVLVGLQGGGVCVFEDDCSAKLERAPGLFTAMDDEPLGGGIASEDPMVSPFVDWTKVYLPYCTQDVFAGGGETEDLGSIQLPRYGSVNLRASMRMIRDELWRLMDQEEGPGFRPDQLIALFGGWSAGAYGTIYNYHWMIDDLQWPRTIGFPDAGLALDNGSPLGVYGLGLVKIPAWGTQKFLPPYCFAADCAIGPRLYEALSKRIKRVPEQQLLLLTNPRDQIQQQDAYFMDEAQWINAVRSAYCETRDLPGISYYITSVADESVHVVSVRDELWLGAVGGKVMRDWILDAINTPDAVESWAEEGDFVTQIPGVEPYPCEVSP